MEQTELQQLYQFSGGLNIIESQDSMDADAVVNEITINRDDNDRVGKNNDEKENGSGKAFFPNTSADSMWTRSDVTSANLGVTSVVSCHLDVTDGSPSLLSAESPGENSFASEIYISPAPSISLWNHSPRLTETDRSTTSVAKKTDGRDAGTPYADTKAVLADRRSNFFSEITRCPVLLPSSVSHSSVVSFQPAANIFADPLYKEADVNDALNNSADTSKPSQNEAARKDGATTNGHSEMLLNQLPPCLDINRSANSSLEGDSLKALEPISVTTAFPVRAAEEPVVVIHQAAPPPDTAEVLPPTLLRMAGPIMLEVDDQRPQYCARMEPSPERFWGPSMSPLRLSGNGLSLCGSERTSHVAELKLEGSEGDPEAVVGGRGSRGDFSHLGTLSTPSPQESPPLKTISKQPSSSTSTDSLPSTPSSASLSSHQKGGNLEKLRTFFGENAPRMFESKSDSISAEPSPEPLMEGVISESKKTELQKVPVLFDIGGKTSSSERSFKNKKAGWSLSGKSHGTRSPGAKPKKTTERGGGGDMSESIKHKEKETWKGKMARTILRYGSGPILSGIDVVAHADALGVIGVPLEFCAPSPFNELVPLIVSVCTRIVEEKGLQNQGIYRVPGNTGAINQLIEEMNKDPAGLCLENEKWHDVNLVSSLLKLFFRKLPDSLITDDLYEPVIDANRMDNSTRRMLKLKKLLHELPEHNFETFHFLAQHLRRVANNEEVNKMDARNLAIVFGPTLVRPQDNDMVNMVKDMTDQCRIIESIILHVDWFFGSWDEDVNVPVDEESDEPAPISGMNDELLAKAESLAITHHVSNRDVIQMIVKAANKKLRSRGKSKPCGSVGDLGTYEECNRSISASESNTKLELDSPSLCVALSEEVLLEVKKYPAYHFDEICFLSTENAKPCFRRAHSNDYLTDSPRVFLGDPKIQSMPRNFCKTLKSVSSEESENFGGSVTEQDPENYESRRYAT